MNGGSLAPELALCHKLLRPLGGEVKFIRDTAWTRTLTPLYHRGALPSMEHSVLALSQFLPAYSPGHPLPKIQKSCAHNIPLTSVTGATQILKAVCSDSGDTASIPPFPPRTGWVTLSKSLNGSTFRSSSAEWASCRRLPYKAFVGGGA